MIFEVLFAFFQHYHLYIFFLWACPCLGIAEWWFYETWDSINMTRIHTNKTKYTHMQGCLLAAVLEKNIGKTETWKFYSVGEFSSCVYSSVTVWQVRMCTQIAPCEEEKIIITNIYYSGQIKLIYHWKFMTYYILHFHIWIFIKIQFLPFCSDPCEAVFKLRLRLSTVCE